MITKVELNERLEQKELIAKLIRAWLSEKEIGVVPAVIKDGIQVNEILMALKKLGTRKLPFFVEIESIPEQLKSWTAIDVLYTIVLTNFCAVAQRYMN